MHESSFLRRSAFGLLLCTMVSCQPTPVQSQPLVPTVHAEVAGASARLNANLWPQMFYQWDCLTHNPHCSRESFRQLWQTAGVDVADYQNYLAQLKAKYARQFQINEPPANTGLPFRFEGISLWDKIRQAALKSSAKRDFYTQMELVLLPTDAEALTQRMENLETKLSSWWEREGLSTAAAARNAFSKVLSTEELSRLLTQAGQFYEADLNAQSVLGFHFMSRPVAGSNTLNGEQIEAQSVIEVRPDREALSNLDVVVHEWSHYLYRRQPEASAIRLINFFVEQQTPEAIGAHHLLNEVMATAIGNGEVNQLLRSPESYARYISRPLALYNDPWINSVALALQTRIKSALRQNETLSSEAFLRDYLRIAQDTLGKESLTRPEILLRTLGALTLDGLTPVLREFQGMIRAGNARSSSDPLQAKGFFERYSALSGIVLARPESVKQLIKDRFWLPENVQADFESALSKGDSFVFGVKRNRQAYTYFVVLPEGAGHRELLEAFRARPGAFTGLMPS